MFRISNALNKARASAVLAGAALVLLLASLIYLAFPREQVLSAVIQLGVVLIFGALISSVALLPTGWLRDKKKH